MESITQNLEEHKMHPSFNLFQLEADEFYKRVNAGFFASIFNNTNFNDTFDDYDEPDCPSFQNAIMRLITMILYSIVCIVGLFGNTLVIYVVLRFSKMQTVTNIYILNLAIADECFLVGIPFLLYTMQIGGWKFGEYMCKAYMVSTSITQFTSSIFLLIMSADRYIAVCHPISSPRYRTPFVSKIVSCVAWLTSVLLMLPVILFASTVVVGEHVSCNIKWPEAENSQSGTTFILYTLALGFATPLTFILVFYCLVIRKLHTVGPKNKSKEKKRSHRKVTKLVLTVITVYVLCWLPYWISQVALINSSPNECASRLEITIFLLAGCFGYSNSAMNPILYAFLSDNFKKSFMKACTCAARKDINAQLQMENSLFPKLGKNRQSERLLTSSSSSLSKKKKNLQQSQQNHHNPSSTQPTTIINANATITATTTTTTSGVSGGGGGGVSGGAGFDGIISTTNTNHCAAIEFNSASVFPEASCCDVENVENVETQKIVINQNVLKSSNAANIVANNNNKADSNISTTSSSSTTTTTATITIENKTLTKIESHNEGEEQNKNKIKSTVLYTDF